MTTLGTHNVVVVMHWPHELIDVQVQGLGHVKSPKVSLGRGHISLAFHPLTFHFITIHPNASGQMF